MFQWIMSQFVNKLFESQKVRVAVAGTLTALAFKVCAYLSAHLGLIVTPDTAVINVFVDWVFKLTAGIIAGHVAQDVASNFAPPIPEPDDVTVPVAVAAKIPVVQSRG